MITKSSFIKQLLICGFSIIVILLLETFTDFDISIQKIFYNYETSEWLITKSMHGVLTYVFYTGYKTVLILISLVCLVRLIKSIRKRQKEAFRNNLLFVLALGVTPLLVSGLKATTNIYCPYQIKEFGGKYTYQRVLELAKPENSLNSDYHKGRGFPAGHASGGFALMVLFYIYKNKKKWLGLFIGQFVGWITGLYQVLRGEHFVSHNFITILIAWAVIVFFTYYIDLFILRKNNWFIDNSSNI